MKHFNFCKDTFVPLQTISWGGISSGFPTKLKPDSDVRSPVKILEKKNDLILIDKLIKDENGARLEIKNCNGSYRTFFRMIV